MDENHYTELGKRAGSKINHTEPSFFKGSQSLEDLLEENKFPTSAEIVTAYLNSIQKILDYEHIEEVISESINLKEILDEVDRLYTTPSMMRDSLYLRLSPIFMRYVLSSVLDLSLDKNNFVKELMEVFRVVLEEEYHHWRETSMDIDK
ncbi:MAG: hypothetical protein HOE90_20565 [Bacteriovoracaceae bacterium]|jgi:hypothetical protein|nr:hypothetical protein [Bacteriovoracaceae bacterium]